MTTTSHRIPPALSPYIHIPPHGSLHLVTSVLGASANWLLIRYLAAALGVGASSSAGAGVEQTAGKSTEDTAVVFVSFVREWEFWRTEAKRAGGLDLAALQQRGRFAFVDGLTALFAPAAASPSPAPARGQAAPPNRPSEISPRAPDAARALPTRPSTRAPAPPPSSAAVVEPQAQSSSASAARGSSQASPTAARQTILLTSPDLTHVEQTIQSAISVLQSSQTSNLASASGNRPPSNPRSVLLILDTPSILLHTSPSPTQGPGNTTSSISTDASTALTRLLLHLRASVHSTVIALPADDPFLAASPQFERESGRSNLSNSRERQQTTPLEVANAAFVLGVAHQARCVLSCRRLGTGWARDVSGVVRVTRGGGAWDEDEVGENVDRPDELRRTSGVLLQEGEWLYHVRGDGEVKVWSRGAGEDL